MQKLKLDKQFLKENIQNLEGNLSVVEQNIHNVIKKAEGGIAAVQKELHGTYANRHASKTEKGIRSEDQKRNNC